MIKCSECGYENMDGLDYCDGCGAKLVARPVTGRGTVFTYTVNHHPYNPEIPTPYVIAIVELAEQAGLRVAANIVGCEPDSVTSGMPVMIQPMMMAPGASLGEATAAINDVVARLGLPASIHGTFEGTAKAFQRAVSGEPLLIGPGSIHVAHTEGEYIEKRQLHQAIDLYCAIARKLQA